MRTKRVQISKKQRFRILARDGFKCKYCGSPSSEKPLHVDHILAVCKGGTNDDVNLVASCVPCNLGKSGSAVPFTVPLEEDHIRIKIEVEKQLVAAKNAKKIAKAKEAIRDSLAAYYFDAFGRDRIEQSTFNVLASYDFQHGIEKVYGWIDKVVKRPFSSEWSDGRIGKYISTIRKYEFPAQGENYEINNKK